jgi:hypothetical protein
VVDSNPDHLTCIAELENKLTAQDIAEIDLQNKDNTARLTGEDFVDNLRKKGMTNSRQTAYEVMRKIEFFTAVPWEDGFKYLQWYCESLRKENPGISI